MGKFEKNVVKGLKWQKSLPYHVSKIGPPFNKWPILMDDSEKRVLGARIWCYYMFFNNATPDLAKMQLKWADRHRHPNFDETYIVIGEENSFTVEVTLNEEVFHITPPSAVFIPSGITHSVKPLDFKLEATGGLVASVKNGEYICIPPEEHQMQKTQTNEKYIVRHEIPVLMSQQKVEPATMHVFYNFNCPNEPELKREEMDLIANCHIHPKDMNEVILTVGQGNSVLIDLTLEDEQYRLTPPSAAYIPGGVRHSFEYSFSKDKIGGILSICDKGEYLKV